MQSLLRALVFGALVSLVPSIAFSQASIAGVVRDSSGGVLPGVTVEAASPALIEKVRSAVTDSSGQYRIEDLRPGTYTVTFTLTGFATAQRTGLVVTGSLTTPVNMDMKVGQVTETVAVTGETPVVDVSTTRRQTVMDNETIRAVPSVLSYSSLLVTVPGVQTDRNNVPTGPLIAIFPIHGGRLLESRLTLDGLNIGNAPGGNQPSHYVADVGNATEISFTTSGGLGENETSGLIMNIVPKTGGNNVSGSVFFSGTSEDMQADNYTEELRARGLVAATPLRKVYDLNGSVGGPIVRDRVWYFVQARTQGQKRDIPNLFYNVAAGDPSRWDYQPDLARPAYSDRTWDNISGRFTVQATPRNKFSVFWDEQAICRECTGTTSFSGSPLPTTSPEADGVGEYVPQRVQQVTWSSPLTNRLLLDAAAGTSYYQWGNSERTDNQTRDLVRILNVGPTVIEADDPSTPENDAIVINGMTYRSQNYMEAATNAVTWRGTASFITGAHNLKVGYQGNWWKDDRNLYTNANELQYFLLANGALPFLIQEYISPFNVRARAAETSFFAQEQWTRGRITLQGGIRYDRAWSWFPEQVIGPTRFVPNPIVFPEQDGIDAYNDITPRFGVAWDIFGNGKTALKVNLGKYLEGASSSGIYYNTNPALRIAGGGFGIFNPSVTRPWTDFNGNFIPDCNLSDPLPQGPPPPFGAPPTGEFCGLISDLNFGTATLSNTYDPELLSGWGVRPSDWAFGISIQHEIVPRASVEVAYHQRWFTGFTVTDNLAVPASGYDRFDFVAPLDPRLPGGGGNTVPDLYNLNPAFVGLPPNNFITAADNYGDQTRRFKGVDVTLNVRAAHGLTFQGGTSTGQLVQDSCEIAAAVPESTIPAFGALTNYCHTATGILTQFRGLVSYTIPKIDVLVSSIYQDKPGQPFIDTSLAANYTASTQEVAPFLGRPLSAFAPNMTINLVEPGTLYGDRIRQWDFRVAKAFRFGGTRTTVGLDLFNMLNSNVTLQYNTTFIAAVPGWLAPTEIMTARMLRLGAEFTW